MNSFIWHVGIKAADYDSVTSNVVTMSQYVDDDSTITGIDPTSFDANGNTVDRHNSVFEGTIVHSPSPYFCCVVLCCAVLCCVVQCCVALCYCAEAN